MSTSLAVNVCIIGGGPAGIMAAIRAARRTDGVVLLERNASLGRKLGLTGRGRCNVTNAAAIDGFMRAFGKGGLFLRHALHRFSPQDLMMFFEETGVKLKTERQGRVFPVSDSSRSIIEALSRRLKESGITTALSASVRQLRPDGGGCLQVRCDDQRVYRARAVVVATGGASYPQTGSVGDGFRIAKELGHRIVDIRPGLVPLETKEAWVKDCQGLTLTNVTVKFRLAERWVSSDVGEMLLTHFGVSGPLVLDMSVEVVHFLAQGPVAMAIDLKPGLSGEEADAKLQRELPVAGAALIKSYLGALLPRSLIGVVLKEAGIVAEKRCSQVTALERRRLARSIKHLPLTVTRARPLAEAMVTQGGVSLAEIDPKTMASRRAPGVFFCGEVLDLAAVSGGYNLQAAFSTGYVAGENAGQFAGKRVNEL